ncbi:MAG: hypothetical protein WDA70_01625 [Lysobacteraceae bacterium]
MRCSELASRRLPPQVGLFDALLLHWLVVGALVLMLAPAWQHAWLGWLPYWLVLVPAALLGWRWMAAKRRAGQLVPALPETEPRRVRFALRRGLAAQPCTLRATLEIPSRHAFHPASHRPRSRPGPGRPGLRRRRQQRQD